MYKYLINFRPVLLGAPLQLGALSVRLVRLWVTDIRIIIQQEILADARVTRDSSVCMNAPREEI